MPHPHNLQIFRKISIQKMFNAVGCFLDDKLRKISCFIFEEMCNFQLQNILLLPSNIQNIIYTKTALPSHPSHHWTMVLTKLLNVLIHWFTLIQAYPSLHAYSFTTTQLHSKTQVSPLLHTAWSLSFISTSENVVEVFKCTVIKKKQKLTSSFLTFILWYLKTCSMFRTQKTVICTVVNEKIS